MDVPGSRWTLRPPNSHKKRSRSSFFLRSMALSGTPWTLFLGAGNETLTRRVSRCFPNSFFAEVTSEDLNCSLVLYPRQRVRPRKSTEVQRRTLSAPYPHPARRHPHGLELATHIPFAASVSPTRYRIGSRHPKSTQFGCHCGKARTEHRGTHLHKPRRKNAPWP